MRCEVVAVGTELLLGQIVDTNSAWIGEQLALAGIDSLYQTKVGDNLERIVSVLRVALGRSDAVIVCGGLGPTHDDITREAIAEVMGAPLRRDAALVERISAMFASRHRAMPPSNLRQADVPEGATVIPQTRGTAPGLICPVGGAVSPQVIYAVPGVPHEMRDMLDRAVLPDLRRRAGVAASIVSRTLRTWGETEAGLAELLAPHIAALDEAGNPTIAFLASGIEGIKVRITAKAPSEASARAAIAREEQAIREVLGDLVFGVDAETMEQAVVSQLQSRGLTLGLAESLTGGMIGARLTAVPGVSKTFAGGIVSYQSQAKFDLLGVPPGPVVNAATVEAMARGARKLLRSDVALAVTGVAGPEPQDGEPPGTVFVGIAMGDEVSSRKVVLPGDRERVREYTVITALDALRHRLLAAADPPASPS